MIYGIGVDIVRISRIDRMLRKWGDRFIERVYRPAEIRLCSGRPYPASAFALRFAAKEAFSKALGSGMRGGVRWRDIETVTHPSGKPDLRLHGACAELCRRKGIGGIHLSLSDEGDYGVATVVMEKVP